MDFSAFARILQAAFFLLVVKTCHQPDMMVVPSQASWTPPDTLSKDKRSPLSHPEVAQQFGLHSGSFHRSFLFGVVTRGVASRGAFLLSVIGLSSTTWISHPGKQRLVSWSISGPACNILPVSGKGMVKANALLSITRSQSIARS